MPAERTIRAAVVGATGYTGLELVRLLAGHPHAELAFATSESSAGKRLSDLHPALRGIADIELGTMDALSGVAVDVVFLALPHLVSMDFVAGHDLVRTPLIDLSADFRLDSPEAFHEWYGEAHRCPELLGLAVYGLPELNRDEIRSARLVANPGCYPTSAILPLAPLLRAGLVEPHGIVVDSKSGVTGAGNKPKAGTHFPHVNENFAAYGLRTHRHTPEISQALARAGGREVSLQFTPHLLPVNRGILTTIYARARAGTDEAGVRQALADAYRGEYFVRLADAPPSLSQVRGSNFCDIHAVHDERTGNVLLVSVIDNLMKGAAGQAVQNMNIMFGLDETAGLRAAPLAP